MAPMPIDDLARQRIRELELKADQARRVAQARQTFRDSRQDRISRLFALKPVKVASFRRAPLHRRLFPAFFRGGQMGGIGACRDR